MRAETPDAGATYQNDGRGGDILRCLQMHPKWGTFMIDVPHQDGTSERFRMGTQNACTAGAELAMGMLAGTGEYSGASELTNPFSTGTPAGNA